MQVTSAMVVRLARPRRMWNDGLSKSAENVLFHVDQLLESTTNFSHVNARFINRLQYTFEDDVLFSVERSSNLAAGSQPSSHNFRTSSSPSRLVVLVTCRQEKFTKRTYMTTMCSWVGAGTTTSTLETNSSETFAGRRCPSTDEHARRRRTS